jgi:hypothetical protein
MSKNSQQIETFEEFRRSFFYGTRSDMSFKFLDHLTDEEGSAFLSKLFTDVTAAIDSGETKQLKKTLIEGQSAAHAHPSNFTYRNGPFSPFAKDLAEGNFTMLTSSGHFPAGMDPKPFGAENMSQDEAENRIRDFLKEKPKLSEIPFSISPEQLRVRHGGYDIQATRQDPNVTFPWERLKELQAEGLIGSLTEYCYSFVGACSQKRLIKKALPAWIELMKIHRVDGALLIPV